MPPRSSLLTGASSLRRCPAREAPKDDRKPWYIAQGKTQSLPRRRPCSIDSVHAALAQGEIVRAYVKWTERPAALEAAPDVVVRDGLPALVEVAAAGGTLEGN